MNYEFLTSQYGFSNTSQDGALSIGSKVSAKKKELVLTEKDVSNANSSNQSFADFLKSQKERVEKNKSQNENQATKSPVVSDKREAFLTKSNAVPFSVSETEADAYVLNLTAFGDHLRELIENIDEQDNTSRSEVALIEIDAVLESDAGAFDKISNLLGIFNAYGDGEASLSSEDQITSLLRLVDQLSAEQATLSGLSPEELTDLQDQVQKFLAETLEQDDIDALHSVMAQFVTLASPPSETRQSNDARAESVVKLGLTLNGETNSKTAQPLNGFSQNHSDARYDARYDGTSQADLGRGRTADDGGFDNALKAANQIKGDGAAAQTNTPAATASARFLLNAPLLSAFGSFGGGSESALLSTPFVQQSSTALSSSLTNVITQAQNASLPHPATQAVSLTIVKAAKGGEKTDIKLQLNPPELGRVDVKMSIDKDSKTKIVLTVEKPETYLMLQRDADALNRALADAGLDSQGDIAFEMASDSHDSDKGRGDQSSQNNGRGGDGSNQDPDLIETTMDWHVDPDSGHMRYNLLV